MVDPTRIVLGDEQDNEIEIADAIVTGSTIRYADPSGTPHSVTDETIRTVVSDAPLTVVINDPEAGENVTYRYVNYVGTDGDQLYLSGPDQLKRQRGEIKRIRQMRLG